MKPLAIALFITLTTITMKAQETFVYHLKLLEKYKVKNHWTEKEHEIQKEHVAYLDSLTDKKKLIIAGISEEGLKNQKGLVLLRVKDYQEALSIVQNDPSIRQGMMTADIQQFNIYFGNIE